MFDYGLIGFPLGHSFSKKYFETKFKQKNITNAQYFLFEISQIEELPNLISARRNLRGLSVTIPYKERVIPYLDELSEEAKAVGAVNTIKILRTKNTIRLKGYNTDIHGFTGALTDTNRSYKNALIAGTGGASKAVSYALSQMGTRYSFVSRTQKPECYTYQELTESILSGFDLIVNTSPLGMFPDTQKCPPIPYEYLNRKQVLFDLVYNPVETLFMKKGKAQGCAAYNGLSMLHYQADKAWSIFEIDKLA